MEAKIAHVNEKEREKEDGIRFSYRLFDASS
jgi:hypothetical protein